MKTRLMMFAAVIALFILSGCSDYQTESGLCDP